MPYASDYMNYNVGYPMTMQTSLALTLGTGKPRDSKRHTGGYTKANVGEGRKAARAGKKSGMKGWKGDGPPETSKAAGGYTKGDVGQGGFGKFNKKTTHKSPVGFPETKHQPQTYTEGQRGDRMRVNPEAYKPAGGKTTIKLKGNPQPGSAKAKKMLKHGKVRGKALTAKQKRYLGARAGGAPMKNRKKKGNPHGMGYKKKRSHNPY